jgi:dTDP-glucose 4,6-dehydratase
MHLLVTGGAGFIGRSFVKLVLERYPDDRVTVLDKLTYAGRLENLVEFQADPRYRFVRGDIADPQAVEAALVGESGTEDFGQKEDFGRVDALVSFAAETHVDRSLSAAGSFITTDVYGVHVLLEAIRQYPIERFLLVSTDEVYGSVEVGSSREGDRLDPRSPYAASKASGELLARAYFASYDLPILITRGSNTFGPYQYPEKLLPLFITNALDELPLPLYGDGQNVRDWLAVEDHCRAIDLVLRQGTLGEVYNVGGGNERTNLGLTRQVLSLLGKSEALIRFVADRPGHDRRYSVDSTKLRALGWQPEREFERALAATVSWYIANEDWWRPLKSGEWTEYYREHYGERLANA